MQCYVFQNLVFPPYDAYLSGFKTIIAEISASILLKDLTNQILLEGMQQKNNFTNSMRLIFHI